MATSWAYLGLIVSVCTIHTVVYADPCLTSPCGVGGNCTDEGSGSYSCVCNDGFQLSGSGHTCEDVDECTNPSPPCNASDQCVNFAGGYICLDMGFYNNLTMQSGSPMCEDLDECVAGYCGGSEHNCTNTEGSYTCSCADGYEVQSVNGNNTCEDTNECGDPFGFTCGPPDIFGLCVNTPGSYYCNCAPYFVLVDGKCEVPVIPLAGCANDTCGEESFNNCTTVPGGYECNCGQGFYHASPPNGTCIDVPECGSSPCQNGATCTENEPNSYQCICPTGYTGPLCETIIDYCVSTPCKNGGVCSPLVNAYSCTCPPAYTGTNCEIRNRCSPNPCSNGGNCRSSLGSYVCTCVNPFYGRDCNLHACLPSPCLNGGTCSVPAFPAPASASCQCPPGWTGDRCESIGAGSGTTSGTWIGVGVGTAAGVALLATVVAVGLYMGAAPAAGVAAGAAGAASTGAPFMGPVGGFFTRIYRVFRPVRIVRPVVVQRSYLPTRLVPSYNFTGSKSSATFPYGRNPQLDDDPFTDSASSVRSTGRPKYSSQVASMNFY